MSLGGDALGFLDPRPQHPGALDEILELRGVRSRRVAVLDEAAGRLVGEALRLGGRLARGGALLGHPAVDVLVGERRRVDVADEDEDARQAGVGVGLDAVAHDALDGLQRVAVAQAQRLGMPAARVARAQLGQQRRELPAERERDRDDDELQPARLALGAPRRERAAASSGRRAGRAAAPRSRRARRLVGARDEDLGDRLADEPLGLYAEQPDDADAAFGDRSVGGAEDVAAVGEAEQHLFELLICDDGGSQTLALKTHAPSIGASGG